MVVMMGFMLLTATLLMGPWHQNALPNAKVFSGSVSTHKHTSTTEIAKSLFVPIKPPQLRKGLPVDVFDERSFVNKIDFEVLFQQNASQFVCSSPPQRVARCAKSRQKDSRYIQSEQDAFSTQVCKNYRKYIGLNLTLRISDSPCCSCSCSVIQKDGVYCFNPCSGVSPYYGASLWYHGVVLVSAIILACVWPPLRGSQGLSTQRAGRTKSRKAQRASN